MLNETVEKQRPARTRMGYSKWATRPRLSATICKVFRYHLDSVVYANLAASKRRDNVVEGSHPPS